ncbi:autotransporter domain-containing protein [Cupriavidus sp. AU9028]|uniref:autotransporter domain-containing protein n=1 Tax=Cupriavidus sp. AU9028 TaxID=2871157 RepID=UPI001C944CA9|nr:autotransporter domain-containing protein [Cupriavidus sp. AU9028]MBY4895699.1 autotransporter domain-containing protein [Cupriavidus sp. AU9028]
MNKTYRLVWSARHRSYVPASELAATRGKTAGGIVTAALTSARRGVSGRFFAFGKLAGAALLAMGFAMGAGAAPVLVSEQPWGSTNDQSAMDAAYGAGNWTFYNNYGSAGSSVDAIFAGSTNFVYLQGSAASDLSLKAFLGTNESTILDWVSSGGNLLLESAGWNTSIKLGGATLTYGGGSESATGKLTEAGERLFKSTPIANTSRSGSSLAHDAVIADDGVELITFIEGSTQNYGIQPIVAGYQYGKGYLLYSGLTLYQFHSTTDGGSLGDDAPSWLLNMIEGFKSPGQIGEAANGGKPVDILPGAVQSGADLAANKLNPVFDGGTLKMDVAQGAYAQNFTINTNGGAIDQAGNTSVFTGVFADGASGSGALTISNSGSAGAIVLTGSNTYTGATVIDSGATLALAGAGSIALSSGVSSNGVLDLSATDNGASVRSLAGTGAVVLGDKGLTLTNAGDTFSGTIAGTGSVTVSGGTQTLSGTNAHAGGTYVRDGGALRVSADANLGTGQLALDGGILETTASFATSRDVALQGNGGAFHTDNGTTLALQGNIAGSGLLVKSGAGTLELAGDNVGGSAGAPGAGWTGGMLVNAGTVEVTHARGLGTGNVVLDGGSIRTRVDVVSNQSIALGGGTAFDTATGTTATLAGNLVTGGGDGSCFVKTGQGTLNVAGNATLAKGTCVEQGTLRANGLLDSNVTVASGAMLGGAGIVLGSVDVRGTLSPGNSPGYLTVAGTVNMLEGSTYREDISGTMQAGPATPMGAAGYYSYLRVTDGGQFNIGANTTLAPQLENLFSPSQSGYGSATYTPRLGDGFRIVTAEGGINGRFASVAQPTGLAANTRFAVFYDALGSNSIDLRVVPTSYGQWLAGGNRNAASAAEVLDGIAAANEDGSVTTGQQQLLYVAATQSEAGLTRFVTGLAGEVHGAMAAAAPQAGQRLAGSVLRQLDAGAAGAATAAAPGQALWVDVGADHGRWSGRGASAFSTNRSQFVFGADVLGGDTTRAGLGFSYSNTNVGANGGSGNIDEYMGFAYGQAALGPVVVDGMAGFGTNDWHTQRTDVTGLSAGSLKTDASGHSTQLGMGVRAPVAMGRAVLEPFARVLWQKSTRGAAGESADTPASLALGEYSATGNRVTLGVTARSSAREATPGELRYQVSAGIGRDQGDLLQPTVQGSLAGIGMGITSPDVGRVFGQLGFSGKMQLSKQASAYLGLNGEVRRGKHDVGVSGGVRVSF